MRHKWREIDDIAALYIYKFEGGEDALTREFLCDKLHLDRGSFGMRVQNFRALDGQGGLSNHAKQSLAIYQRFYELTEPELRAQILTRIASEFDGAEYESNQGEADKQRAQPSSDQATEKSKHLDRTVASSLLQDKQHLIQMREISRKRLRVLELQQAQQGYHVLPHIVTEIDDLRVKIASLDAQIAQRD